MPVTRCVMHPDARTSAPGRAQKRPKNAPGRAHFCTRTRALLHPDARTPIEGVLHPDARTPIEGVLHPEARTPVELGGRVAAVAEASRGIYRRP